MGTGTPQLNGLTRDDCNWRGKSSYLTPPLPIWRKLVKHQKLLGALAVLIGAVVGDGQAVTPIRKTWDAIALADWATPVVGLNVRPGHFSKDEYYRAPID